MHVLDVEVRVESVVGLTLAQVQDGRTEHAARQLPEHLRYIFKCDYIRIVQGRCPPAVERTRPELLDALQVGIVGDVQLHQFKLILLRDEILVVEQQVCIVLRYQLVCHEHVHAALRVGGILFRDDAVRTLAFIDRLEERLYRLLLLRLHLRRLTTLLLGVVEEVVPLDDIPCECLQLRLNLSVGHVGKRPQHRFLVEFLFFLFEPCALQCQRGVAHKRCAAVERVLATEAWVAEGMRLSADGRHQFLVDFLLAGETALVEQRVVESIRVGTGYLCHRDHLPYKTVGKPDGVRVVAQFGNRLRHPRWRFARTVVYARCQSVESGHCRQRTWDELAHQLSPRDTAPRTHALRHRLGHHKSTVADVLRLSDTARCHAPLVVRLDDVAHPLRLVHIDIYRICHSSFVPFVLLSKKHVILFLRPVGSKRHSRVLCL